MEKYYEQLTSAYISGAYKYYRYLIIAMVILSAISIVFFFPISIISALLAIIFYFVKRKSYVEYEYVFTSGDISIDMITEAQKRKKLIKFDISDLIMLAPEGSIHLDGIGKGKKVTAYPKDSKEKRYVAIIKKNNEVNEIYFTPDDVFINQCFRSSPRNVKKRDFV